MGPGSKSASTKTSIRDSIERIVRQQFPELDIDNVIIGEVVSVYSTPGEVNYGTCDIQPNNGDPLMFNVRLNGTLEGITRGHITFPKLNSDVIVQLSDNGEDSFVLMYSHVDSIIDVADVSILSKVEKVINNDPLDYENISLTGEVTEFSHDGTLIKVSLGNSDEGKTFEWVVDKDNSKMALDDGTDNAYLEIVGPGNIDIKSNQNRLISDPDGSVEPMALGDTLAQLLTDLLTGLEVATVSTAIGTQPLINKATFTNLKGQVDSIKSAINFLQ